MFFIKKNIDLRKCGLYTLIFISWLIASLFLDKVFQFWAVRETELDKEMVILEYHELITNIISEYIENEHYYSDQKQNEILNKQYQKGLVSITLNGRELYIKPRLIKEKIDKLVVDYVMYKITLNNVLIAESNYDYTQHFVNKTKHILGNNKLEIQIYIDHNSEYYQNFVRRNDNRINLARKIIIPITIVALFIVIAYTRNSYRIKDIVNKNKKLITSKQHIIEMIKVKKEMSSDFYKRFQNKNIPIIPLKEFSNIHENYTINLKEIFNNVEKIISGYSVSNNYNIKFKYDFQLAEVKLPLEQTIFDRLMISIITNILSFIKSKKQGYHISVIVNHNEIVIAFDTFALDYDTLLYYTEKIFEETSDPFCLSLNEVFSFFDDININHTLSYRGGENIIKILLPHDKDKEYGKIISFAQRK